MGRVKHGPHKRNRVYNRSHVEIVLRVRQFFEKEKLKQHRISVNKVVERLSLATGIGRTLLSRVKCEEDVMNWKIEPGKMVQTEKRSPIPDKFACVVRKVVRDIFLEKKQLPTVDSVFTKIAELKAKDVEHLNLFEEGVVPDSESPIWPWSRSSLYRFMSRIGFIYDEHVSDYERSKTRADIVAMRYDYLEWVNKYRGQGYEIYYTDETWVFKNMTCKKVWRDMESDSTDSTFNVPSGNGERSILAHVGSKSTGLLEGCMLLYRGAKSNKSADYHSKMCWDVFSDWCRRIVFPAISKTKRKSVLVLDRATYHTKLDDDDRKPVPSWNKNRLSDAILRWGGPKSDWPIDWKIKKSKAQLLEYAREIYPTPKYSIQKIADEFTSDVFDLKILFLPVAHPELNPIEMAWSWVKIGVARRNLKFNLGQVEEETRKQIASLTVAMFSNYVGHALKEERSYKEASILGDTVQEGVLHETEN